MLSRRRRPRERLKAMPQAAILKDRAAGFSVLCSKAR
jgi:hypothetical protein